jgi:aspartate/tyrosine/aromatic aminotransferase
MQELDLMRKRMTALRKELGGRLARPHIQKGLGMFCMTGLDEKQVDWLRTEYAIYMTRDGRINVCGLNQNNIDYVVDAILTII